MYAKELLKGISVDNVIYALDSATISISINWLSGHMGSTREVLSRCTRCLICEEASLLKST